MTENFSISKYLPANAEMQHPDCDLPWTRGCLASEAGGISPILGAHWLLLTVAPSSVNPSQEGTVDGVTPSPAATLHGHPAAALLPMGTARRPPSHAWQVLLRRGCGGGCRSPLRLRSRYPAAYPGTPRRKEGNSRAPACWLCPAVLTSPRAPGPGAEVLPMGCAPASPSPAPGPRPLTPVAVDVCKYRLSMRERIKNMGVL